MEQKVTSIKVIYKNSLKGIKTCIRKVFRNDIHRGYFTL